MTPLAPALCNSYKLVEAERRRTEKSYVLLALTDATGFIGQHLLRELPKRGYRLRVLLRRPAAVPVQTAIAVIGDLARPS